MVLKRKRTFCARTPKEMNGVRLQVTSTIMLFVDQIQFCLSAPLVESSSVSSIINLMPSIILSSPNLCV